MSTEKSVICSAKHLCGMPNKHVIVPDNPMNGHVCACCKERNHGFMCAYTMGGDDMLVEIKPQLLPIHARDKCGNHSSWLCKLCYESTHGSMRGGKDVQKQPATKQKNNAKRPSKSALSLRSRGKDQRLCGGKNGIEYHQLSQKQKKTRTKDTVNLCDLDSSSSDSDSNKSDEDANNSDSDESVVSFGEIQKRSNALLSKQAPRTSSTLKTTSTSIPKQTHSIMKLSPNLQSRMESKLGARDRPGDTSTHSREKMIQHANAVIGNRSSILQAATNISEDLYLRAVNAIPSAHHPIKEKRPTLVASMVKMYSIIHELMQYDSFKLSNTVMANIEVFIDILESAEHECHADVERESHPDESIGKTVLLPVKKRHRMYLQGGGKKMPRNDSGDCIVKCCPKCELSYFDKEPDYDENRKYNSSLKQEWIEKNRHLEEYLNQSRSDPPVDAKGKAITSYTGLKNPTYKPLLLRCHISENYQSMHRGGRKCHFVCKINGKQYPPGKCPACQKSCSYVWDRLKHKEKLEYFSLKMLRAETNSDERASANLYLDKALGHGRSIGDDFGEQLNEMREEGNLNATDDEIMFAVTEASNVSTAQYITHNPPNQSQTSFLQRVMAQADHPNGPSWSNTTNTNMRQPNAHQRSVNTRLVDTVGARGMSGETIQEKQQLDLVLQKSLEEQSYCCDTNTAIIQSLQPNNNSFDSFMSNQNNINSFNGNNINGFSANSNTFSNNNIQNTNNSISPMPTIGTNTFVSAMPSTTPEHVGKMKNALMDYSMEGDDVNEDAVLVVQAIGDASHPSNKTLCDYSKMLHGKDDMATPMKAKKLVSVYHASLKKAKHT